MKTEKFIALDPKGKPLTSLDFSKRIQLYSLKGGSRINFVIGGPDGLSEMIKLQALEVWSLSPLTFTHQLTRIVLLEQIYRSYEISRNSNYHK